MKLISRDEFFGHSVPPPCGRTYDMKYGLTILYNDAVHKKVGNRDMWNLVNSEIYDQVPMLPILRMIIDQILEDIEQS